MEGRDGLSTPTLTRFKAIYCATQSYFDVLLGILWYFKALIGNFKVLPARSFEALLGDTLICFKSSTDLCFSELH